MLRPKKINYLSNKDILAEIHKSKSSYGYYVDPIYRDYDVICTSLDDITDEGVEQARIARADRLAEVEKVKQLGEMARRTRANPVTFDPNSFDRSELVFRLITAEHIPFELSRTRKSKTKGDKAQKLNFTPYKHFIIEDKEGDNFIFKEVGRSHWRYALDNGEFCSDHGKISNRLALMCMELVERYAQKGNWRGYTWIDDMKGQALVQLTEAALKFDEHMGDNPFAYYTMIVTNCFRGVLNSEEKVSDIKNKILIDSGFNPSFDYQVQDQMNQRGDD